jgi:tRNA A-37 threonylcarbamoyl transferase component Bud32
MSGIQRDGTSGNKRRGEGATGTKSKRAKTTAAVVTGVVTRARSIMTATAPLTWSEEVAFQQEEDAFQQEEDAFQQEEDAWTLDLKERPIPKRHGEGSVAFWTDVQLNWLNLNNTTLDVPFLGEKIRNYNVLVSRLPGMHPDLEEVVNPSLDGDEALDVSQVAPVVILSSEQQSIFDSLPEAMRDCYISDMSISESRRQISESRRQQLQLKDFISQLKDEITGILTRTMLAVVKIGITLSFLSGLCQAEYTRDTRTSRVSRKSSMPVDDEAIQLPALIEPHSMVYPLIDSRCDFDDSSHLCRVKLLNPTADADMVSLSETLSDIFEKSIFLRKTKQKKELAKYKDKITTTKKLLKNALTLTSMATSCQKVAGEQKMHMPGPTCQEVEGVQEIFQVILEAICYSRTKAQANTAHSPLPPDSPKKTTVSKEKFVQGTDTRKKRRVDFTVWKRGRFIRVMRDDCMQMPVEVKAGQRSDKNVLEMVRQAREQTLSHLAKAVGPGFNFASRGIDTHATGVAASLFYVEVLQLKLDKMGTESASLKLHTTGPLPLLSKSQYMGWFNSDKVAKKRGQALTQKCGKAITDMAEVLYPGESTGTDASGVPLGLKALWITTGMTSKELFGPDWESILKCSPSSSVRRLLGSGAYGMVLLKDNNKGNETALKVSKYGRYRHLDNEVKILRKFQQWKTKIVNVPTLVEDGTIMASIGGVQHEMRSIEFSPVGQSPLFFCSRPEYPAVLLSVAAGISSALKFLHNRHYAHNDVSDKNVIIVTEEAGGSRTTYQAVLIDFGIACPTAQAQTAFLGTREFVHREIHSLTRAGATWYPQKLYDTTSLGFTMAVLANGGKLTWAELSTDSSDEIFNSRCEEAAASINCFDGINSTLKAGWIGWVNLDKRIVSKKSPAIPCISK